MRAEIPFDNANIWVPLAAGGELFVSAVFTDTDHATFNVDDERVRSGVTVEYGTHAGSGAAAIRFRCSDTNFYVHGDPPSEFADIDAFVDAFLMALNCI